MTVNNIKNKVQINNDFINASLPKKSKNNLLTVIFSVKNTLLAKVTTLFILKRINKEVTSIEQKKKNHLEAEIQFSYHTIKLLSEKCTRDRKRIAEIEAEIILNPKNIFNLKHNIRNIMSDIKRNENTIKTQKRYIKMINKD